jgi:hypothetical protein
VLASTHVCAVWVWVWGLGLGFSAPTKKGHSSQCPSRAFGLPTGLNDGDSRKERRRRLECAFPLAEEAGGGRRGSNLLKRLDDTSVIMTTANVYTPEVACRMWGILADAATALGYGLPNGITEKECKRVMRSIRNG